MHRVGKRLLNGAKRLRCPLRHLIDVWHVLAVKMLNYLCQSGRESGLGLSLLMVVCGVLPFLSAQERLIDTADESIASQSSLAEVVSMARWSEPVNGLAARVDFVDPTGPAGYVVLLQLRNVGASRLRVPMGNPPDSQLARLFELHKRDRRGAWHRAPWMPGEHLDGDGPKVERGGVIYAGLSAGQDIVRPPVVLQPGEGALVYLWGDRPGGDERRHPLDVKIVLRLKEGLDSAAAVDGPSLTAPKGGKLLTATKPSSALVPTWTGVLETLHFQRDEPSNFTLIDVGSWSVRRFSRPSATPSGILSLVTCGARSSRGFASPILHSMQRLIFTSHSRCGASWRSEWARLLRWS